jgi:nitrite reductase/ring-hydroxylating ferredoxin subunit
MASTASIDILAPNPVLRAILKQGSYLIVSRFDTQEDVLMDCHALIREGVTELCGAPAGERIAGDGLGILHEVLPAEQIGAIRDFVMPRLRPQLLQLACSIGRSMLGIEGEFFVDDYTILRINFPYLVAREASHTAENPGIGRVDQQTRKWAQASKVVDPVYNPRSYHNNEPPPAWAHGAHQDTWTGHSRFGINLWWAIDEVPAEASMVFYPETFGRPFAVDPRSLYLKEGQPLPKPTKIALRRGEMVIFNPEMLHGTHLNVTTRTRVALSTRLNPRKPAFDPGCFYAREFWHSSRNIEAGRSDQVIQFKRDENLEATPAAPTARRADATPVIAAGPGNRSDGWLMVCASEQVAPRNKLLVRIEEPDLNVLLIRGDTELHAIQARCPHLNVALADGYHDDRAIYCPAHAVSYSLHDGRSSCPALSVHLFDVRERDGTIWLRVPANTSRGELMPHAE